MADIQQEKNKRIKLIRLALKLNQQEMADVLGIQRSSLSRIENMEDNRNVPKSTFFVLNKKYGLTEEYWEHGKGPMFETKNDEFVTKQTLVNYNSLERVIELLERTITDKDAIIAEKQKRIEWLEHYIEVLTGVNSDKSTG